LAMPMSAGRSSAARSANWNRCGAVQAMIERSRGEKDFEHQYRLSMSDGSVKHVHAMAHATTNASGPIGGNRRDSIMLNLKRGTR